MERTNNFKRSMKRKMRIQKLFIVTFVGLILLLAIGNYMILNFNDTEYIITITDKERVYEGSGEGSSSKYLVFGDDESGNSLVFENTDCFIRGKWNSSNLQGKMKEGNVYRITVVRYRIPFFSMYQNIIKVEEIERK